MKLMKVLSMITLIIMIVVFTVMIFTSATTFNSVFGAFLLIGTVCSMVIIVKAK